MEDKTNTFNKRTLAIGTIVFGWAICGYLFFRSLQLSKGTVSDFDFCKSIFGSSCDDALQNTASWQLGFPIASLGLVYFGLLGLLLVARKPFFDRAALLISSAGIGVSLILSLVIIRKGPTCPLCLVAHIINLFTFINILITVKQQTLFNSPKKTLFFFRPIIWVFLGLLAILLGSFSEVYILANSVGTRTETALNQSYENFARGSVYEFPKDSSSPISGSINAPLQLVVFSSFQCPGCQTFSQSLTNFRKKFGENINIQYKNYPLSSGCNSKLNTDMQPWSCAAALAAIAAHKQGLYWKYHEQLFQSDLQLDENILLTIAINSGLDIEKWESDRKSENAKEILAEDIRLGNQFKIYATPSVFLNGRQISSMNESSVTFLLQKELNRLKNKE